jgi:hypothetical protein
MSHHRAPTYPDPGHRSPAVNKVLGRVGTPWIGPLAEYLAYLSNPASRGGRSNIGRPLPALLQVASVLLVALAVFGIALRRQQGN